MPVMTMGAAMAEETGTAAADSANRSPSATPGLEPDPRLVSESSADTHMLADVERILRLTPEERLQEVANLSRFFTEAKRVGRRA
jgi:hypothetical protein